MCYAPSSLVPERDVKTLVFVIGPGPTKDTSGEDEKKKKLVVSSTGIKNPSDELCFTGDDEKSTSHIVLTNSDRNVNVPFDRYTLESTRRPVVVRGSTESERVTAS